MECQCPSAAGDKTCGGISSGVTDSGMADMEDVANVGSCYVEYDILLRGIPMAVQSLCVTITIVLTVVIVRLRKTKVRLQHGCKL